MHTASKSNTDFFYAFCLGLVFVVIDLAVIIFLTEPLMRWITIANPFISDLVHMISVSCIGTGIGCLTFFLIDKKRLIPMGYSFFPVFAGICYLFVLLNVNPDLKIVAYRLVSFYTLIPTAVGMTVSWGFYWKRFRN